MKVINRSDGNTGYVLPELNVRRIFEPGKWKDIPKEELEALIQMEGGEDLLRDYLLVDDRDWVEKYLEDAPIEYFWTDKEVRKCLFEEDDIELFKETPDCAPQGVIDLIKLFSWQENLNDLNKIKAIQEKTGFDVMSSIEIMKPLGPEVKLEKSKPRRRREA